MIAALEVQSNERESRKQIGNQEMLNLMNEKRNVMKKNELLMEELFNYKKKYEEEKNRCINNVVIKNT
jgi:23S rRNA maturation-related 3'-5' exoribonuclease YhaM